MNLQHLSLVCRRAFASAHARVRPAFLPCVTGVIALLGATPLRASNTPPVARPGGPYTVTARGAIILSGASSVDPDLGDGVASYTWDIDGDGTYGDLTGPTPLLRPAAFTALTPGSHTISLKVTDGSGAVSAVATAAVNVTASPHLASLGVFGRTGEDASTPMASLIEGRDGKLYGTTSAGGDFDAGTVFSMNPDGTGFTTIFSFDRIRGGNPQTALIQAPDGTLYGTHVAGVFSLQPDGSGFTSVHWVNSAVEGQDFRGGLVWGADGRLYGTTSTGGANGGGTVFAVSTSGEFTVLHTFSPTMDGGNPMGGVVRAPDGKLYGTTSMGGANNGGTIFSLAADGTGFTVLRALATADGSQPQAGLVVGSDGKLYGTTTRGGSLNLGTLFSISTDGTFTVVHNFGDTEGILSSAALVQGSNGVLYGTAKMGGGPSSGTVYSVKPDGTAFTVIHALSSASDGATPVASLLLRADGKLYGTASSGGANNVGTAFAVGTDGSWTTLHSFASAVKGAFPNNPVVQGADGRLYGTAKRGPNNTGAVFAVNTDGTGLAVLHAFDAATEGDDPMSGLIQDSAGVLYGVTRENGAKHGGALFSIKSDGSAFSVLHSFDYSADGAYPSAPLLCASDAQLYGNTYLGGTNDCGTIFSMGRDGTGFTVLRSLTDATDGGHPIFGLIEGSDHRLYGSTNTGGPNGGGVVFAMNRDGTGFVVLRAFTPATDGKMPAVMQANDGKLYGTTSNGGPDGWGTVFVLNTDGTGFTILHTFSTTANQPLGPLVQGRDGRLYGRSWTSLFAITLSGTYTEQFNFNGNYVGYGGDGLSLGADGTIYGATGSGQSDYASVFAFSNRAPVAAFTAPASPVAGATATFDASATADADSDTLTYSWNFGDGTAALLATGPTAMHAFATAGTYPVTLTVTDALGASATKSGSVTVASAPTPATITLSNLSANYDGTAKTVTATTNPAGLSVAITYNGSTTAPTAVGTYAVAATITSSGYEGAASGSLVISKGVATVTLGGLTAAYDGSPKSATATTSPSGLGVSLTYNGSTTAPSAVGTYPVVATIADSNYQGGATGTLTITKGTATITLTGLSATFDWSSKRATATTSPAGLSVTLTYNGSTSAPSNAGTYAVVATINDSRYNGTATGTLVIAKATPTLTFNAIQSNSVGQTEWLSASSGAAGGQVTYTTSDATVAKLDGWTLQLVGIGTVTITASLPESSNYAAGSASQTITVTSGPTITRQPAQYAVTTLAGANVSPWDASVDGPGLAAKFFEPSKIAVDGAGNAYVIDSGAIRKVAVDGTVTTLAGKAGISGAVDGTGANARFGSGYGTDLAVDASGNVYVSDVSNETIRKITPAGVVTTLAGTAGAYGSADGTGAAARFMGLGKLGFDASGNLLVADQGGTKVRKVTPDGVVTTLTWTGEFVGSDGAGNGYTVSGSDVTRHGADGTTATYAGLWDTMRGDFNARGGYNSLLAIDNSGTLYAAHLDVLKVTTAGATTTVAGDNNHMGYADGTGTAARFGYAYSGALDASGNLYLIDDKNASIRKITPAGVVTTLAGPNVTTLNHDGVGAAARFGDPWGAAISGSSGYVADYWSHTVRKIEKDGTVTTIAGVPGLSGHVDGPRGTGLLELPQAVAVDSHGNVFVLEASGNSTGSLRKITPDGNLSTITTDASTGSTYRQSLAIDSADTLFLGSGANVVRISAAGVSTTMPTPNGMGVNAIAIVPNGPVYVVLCQNWSASAVYRLSDAGEFTLVAGNPSAAGIADGLGAAARFGAVYSMACDAAGNVYVGDQGGGTIRMIAPDGNVTTIIGQPMTFGVSNGVANAVQFPAYSLYGLATDDTGALYIVDTRSASVRKATQSYPVCSAGNSTTLTVAAIGSTPLSYQWALNGNPIAGATSASFNVTNVQPATAGPYTVTVTNSIGSARSTGVTFTILPSFTSADHATFALGQAGSFTVVAAANPAPTLTLAGTLPAGLTFDAATGVLSGTPTGLAGTATVSFTATNSESSVTQPFTLTINPAAPQIVSIPAASVSGIQGTSLVYGPILVNAAAGSCSFSAIGLPTGLTIAAASGTITGTPTQAGTFQATIVANNVTVPSPTVNTANSRTVTFVIQPPLPSAGSALIAPAATVATSYSFAPTGIQGATSFSATGLPPGLTLNSTTGAIGGTPTAAGSYTVALTASNATGSTTIPVTIVVALPANAPVYSGSTTPAGKQGQTFTFTPNFGTGTGTTYTLSGTLPAGITFDSTAGTLSGTPTESGTFTVTVSGTRSGVTSSATLTLTVNPPDAAPSVVFPAAGNGLSLTLGVPVSTTLATPYQLAANPAAVSPQTVTFAATGLPDGVSLSAVGVLSGTPTLLGTFDAVVTATNSSTGRGPEAVLRIFVDPSPLAPVISSATAIAGRVAQSLSYTLSAAPAATGFVLVADHLPAGVSATLPAGLSLTGSTISGTPTVAGETRVLIVGTNASGTGAAQELVFSIRPAATVPVVNSVASATGTVGRLFGYSITATNAPTAYGLTGTLPAGLTFDSGTGIISGVPTAATTTALVVNVTAVNADGSSEPKSLSVTIDPAPATPSIAHADASISGRVGVAITPYTIAATETPTSFAVAGLPPGLKLDPATGIISGTPTSSGTYTAQVSAGNATGFGAGANLNFVIASAAQAPTIGGVAPTPGRVGTAFSYAIVANTAAGSPVTSYALTGSLPLGLKLNTSTGVIAGTPAEAGLFTVNVTATNTGGTSLPQALVVAINPALSAPAVTSANTATATVGAAFIYQITATNLTGSAPYALPISLDALGLPAGLSVNPATGVIEGVPTTIGTTDVTLVATNAAGTGPSRTLTLIVGPAPAAPVISSPPGVSAQVGTAFSYQIAALNAPTSFDVLGAPGWMAIDTSSGALSGIPAEPGTVTAWIVARNTSGSSNPALLTVYVAAAAGAPVISSTQTATATAGASFSYQIVASGSPTQYAAEGLPVGLLVDSHTGAISGVPLASGSFQVKLTARNAAGKSDPRILQLHVKPSIPFSGN